MDIYQAIWDADMEGNGLQPIPSAKNGDKTQGFVVVDTESEHHILKEVCIPDRKKRSYQLVEKLFNNYSLNQTKREKNTLSESKEMEDFLRMAMVSPPCMVAKKFT